VYAFRGITEVKRISTFIILLVAASLASAQDDTGLLAFGRLDSAVKQAQAFINGQNDNQPSLKLDLQEIGNAATRLRDLYKASLRKKQPENSLPRGYVISLDSDSSSLTSLPDAPRDSRPAIVRDVRDDVWIKAEYATASPGGTFRATVKVTVETERDGKKADGLWVRCNPARDGVTKSPMFFFNSATSPTTSLLPPGSLIMWVESTTGGHVVAEQFIKTGQRGTDQETIRFPIP
jgi:hypothetical protein